MPHLVCGFARRWESWATRSLGSPKRTRVLCPCPNPKSGSYFGTGPEASSRPSSVVAFLMDSRQHFGRAPPVLRQSGAGRLVPDDRCCSALQGMWFWDDPGPMLAVKSFLIAAAQTCVTVGIAARIFCTKGRSLALAMGSGALAAASFLVVLLNRSSLTIRRLARVLFA